MRLRFVTFSLFFRTILKEFPFLSISSLEEGRWVTKNRLERDSSSHFVLSVVDLLREGNANKDDAWFFEDRLVLGRRGAEQEDEREPGYKPEIAKSGGLYKEQKCGSERQRERERDRKLSLRCFSCSFFFLFFRNSAFFAILEHDEHDDEPPPFRNSEAKEKKKDTNRIYSYDYIFVRSLKYSCFCPWAIKRRIALEEGTWIN